jgi:hypothetical protein
MNNKPDLPDGWAMPDDLAKKVCEALNRKPITPEDEFQDALDDMARDIALIEPNPVDWDGCRSSGILNGLKLKMASSICTVALRKLKETQIQLSFRFFAGLLPISGSQRKWKPWV